MNVIHVRESHSLEGEVLIQGSKNAVLPILAATILINGVCVLENCPRITDVECMLGLLRSMGCTTEWQNNRLRIDTVGIKNSRLPKEMAACMRSSVMLLGPLLSRCKEAMSGYPGGCVIGERPIDIHLQVLRQLGAVFTLEEDSIRGTAKQLTGATITLRFPSVGATENGILAAVLAQGTTVLKNCAKEPEIQQLCHFLKKAGADITGIGTDCLTIRGVTVLQEITFSIEADRIVAGTYLLSAAALGGQVSLKNVDPASMEAVITAAENLGCEITAAQKQLFIKQKHRANAISYIKTSVYPGFPTDLQSVLLVVLALGNGESVIEETIFSDRFRIVNELRRMGAQITVSGNCAHIKGVKKLKGRHVVAEDLRGGAALVLAGLLAEGDTFINNCHYIERGYEDICRDYRILGAFAEHMD